MKLKVYVVDLEIPASVKRWGLRIGIPAAVVLGGATAAWAAGLHTWNTGDTLNATDLNNNFSALQSQITTSTLGTRTPSAFHAHLTQTTSVPASSSSTVLFDTADYDINSEYTAATGKFTAKNPGLYAVDCALFYTAQGTVGTWAVNINKNGSVFAYGEQQSSTSTGDHGGVSARATDIIQLAAGDTLTCNAYQVTSTAQNLDIDGTRNTFSATRIY